MFRYYSLVIILQAFCLYHAYTKRSDQKWYYIIVLFPFIGSIIYLYDTFYSRRNVDNIKEEVKTRLVSNYKLNELEKQVAFTNTISNKIELAKEHGRLGNYQKSIDIFLSCNEGIYKDDPDILGKIMQYSYVIEDYEAVLVYGHLLNSKNLLTNTDAKTSYAWAHYQLNQHSEAEKLFKEIDVSFINYEHRLEFAHFLYLTKQNDKSKALLNCLITELESMDAYERRLNKKISQRIKSYLNK